MRCRIRFGPLARTLCLCGWLAAAAVPVHGQASPTPQTPEPKKEDLAPVPRPPAADQSMAAAPTETPSTDSTDATDTAESVSTFDSAVGYIDSAIPANLFRLRGDFAYSSNRPNRAEFIYPKGGPFGPGFRTFSGKVDYQEITPYLEKLVAPQLSVFIEAPYRFINPQFNPDHNGFSDLNAGFKWAFVSCEDLVVSFQTRVWAPTGDAREGLGTRHTSIEPAFLAYSKLTDRLVLESELRYWAPIGGTDFAGDVVRYGIGVSYGERSRCDWWATPVIEFVGWTVLNGKEQVGPSPTSIIDASGDTIVNGKFGVRIGNGDRGDVYVGYGRALTGAVWYKDIIRTELRINY
jgi:hypothetical protein